MPAKLYGGSAITARLFLTATVAAVVARQRAVVVCYASSAVVGLLLTDRVTTTGLIRGVRRMTLISLGTDRQIDKHCA